MDRNPLRVAENDEREDTAYTGQGSEMSPSAISPEGVHPHRLERALQLSEITTWRYPPFMRDMSSNSVMYAQNSVVSDQVHYYPPVFHPPPMMHPNLGPPYFGEQPYPPQGPHAPPLYQTLDSRGSLSSYSSSDTLGSSARRHGNHGRNRKQRRSDSRHGGRGAGAGSPPNRGWHCYDDNTTFYQMIGHIVEISKDQDGSKFIQRRLHVADAYEMQIAFDEALGDVEELWNDVYGNYILQRMLELGTNDMRDRLGRKIVESGVFALSTKVYGCRLIQKALDTLEVEDVASLVGSLKGKVLLLVHDHNGNHVIQKSVTKINEFCQQCQNEEECTLIALLLDRLDMIILEVTNNIKDLALHPYGCRVVQRLIENCTGAQKTHVLDSILKDSLLSMLINHEYGNYVVQRMLTFGRTSDRVAIFDAISTNIVNMSKQKYSSNVVEMMLTYGDIEQRHQIIEEILNSHSVDQTFVNRSAVVSMAGDAYANYVIKTALDIIEEGPKRERLFGILLSDLGVLENSPFSKQVVLRVKAYTRE